MPETDNKTYQVNIDVATVTAKPLEKSETVTQFLFGETVESLSFPDDNSKREKAAYIRCRSLLDSYEGYIRSEALRDEIITPTHYVSALRSFVYRDADFKSPPMRLLSFNSPVRIIEEQDGYAHIQGGGWITASRLDSVETYQKDFVETALKFLHTPYLWGGRTSLGLDCSALIQLSLARAGILCPRDSKDQLTAFQDFSHDLTLSGASIQKGDIVFFKGHVGIMINEEEILNATARHMCVCIEPLKDVAKAYDGIRGIRRLTPELSSDL